MKCPYCEYSESKVIDSRPAEEGNSIRRRRECLECAKRFTTYEKIEAYPLMVIKKDKSRQVFDKNKILGGLFRACEKRPVALPILEGLVSDIEAEIVNAQQREVTSGVIGEMVLARLQKIDDVAYVRFASVYREFGDVDSFMEELFKFKNEG